MKYLSLFSGIGGFELGIQKAYELVENTTITLSESDTSKPQGRGRFGKYAPTCIGFSEIDKYAIQIYEKHFNHKNYGDITKIIASELPDFDLLVGGFPCQAFSIAGKRRGFDDTRGTLFFDIARILKEKRPRNFILENVKGLLSHDSGRTFKTIITTLVELGYCVEWQVLNAKNFGVPQNRERVFIIGHFGGIPERKVFPITQNNSEDIVLPTITTRVTADSNGTYVSERQTQKINVIKNSYYDTDRLYSVNGISRTIRANAGGMGAKTGLYEVSEILETLKFQGLEVTEKGAESLLKAHDIKIRRLTPLECERLMGFEDGWTEGVSDTQRYKTLGNGVVSNVVAEIVKKLGCG